MLKTGHEAPDFELQDQDGKLHKLSDYRGSKVLLYFYPRDNTPGCTKEACEFRDNIKELAKQGLQVLGVSADSVESHKKFAEKYSLPFPLLADTERLVLKAYGVWAKKKMMGREYMGILRTSFLIGEQGKIEKVYEKVKPPKHAMQVLKDTA